MKLELADGLAMSFEGVKNLQEVEKVGIENLKKVAQFSIRFRNKLLRYQKDGHIDWFERIGLSISLVGAVKLATLWHLIKKEIEDLDREEYLELIGIIAEGFGADPELAKDYFGDFIDFIDGLRTFLSRNKK